jgi:hypothetical protein
MRRARAVIAVRALVIGLIGLLLAMTDTIVAVILAYYALYFLLALPFLRLRASTLMALAVVWGVVSPQLSFWLRGMLPDPPRGQVDLIMVLTDPASALNALLFTGYDPAFTWLTFISPASPSALMDLRAITAIALASCGAAVAVVAWVASGALPSCWASAVCRLTTARPCSAAGRSTISGGGTTPADDPTWLFVAPHSGTSFDLIGSGSALAVLGICPFGPTAQSSFPVAAAG